MKINRCILDYLQKCTDCFGEIGCLKEKYVEVDRQAPPFTNPPRCIPAWLKIELNEELDGMVKMEINIGIEEPTDWVSTPVTAEKPNWQLGIFLYLYYFNQAFKRRRVVKATTEEILAQMSNSKFLTKLDASNTY